MVGRGTMNNSNLPEHEQWRDRAACAGMSRDDYQLFYPESHGKGRRLDYAVATDFCNTRCPVKQECLQYAIDNEIRFGVWGGTTPLERGMPTDSKLGIRAADVGVGLGEHTPKHSWLNVPPDAELYEYTFSKKEMEAFAAARHRRAEILARVDAELAELDALEVSA